MKASAVRARVTAAATHPAITASAVAGVITWLLVTWVWPHGMPATAKDVVPFAAAWVVAFLAHYHLAMPAAGITGNITSNTGHTQPIQPSGGATGVTTAGNGGS